MAGIPPAPSRPRPGCGVEGTPRLGCALRHVLGVCSLSSVRVEGDHRAGAGVRQEDLAALFLLGLADGPGGPAERVQRAEETTVGLVFPGDRPVALPAGPAQL